MKVKILNVESQKSLSDLSILYRLTIRDKDGSIKYIIGSNLEYMSESEIIDKVVAEYEQQKEQETIEG